jgi:hypothetical protein
MNSNRTALVEMLKQAVSGAVIGIMNEEKPTPSCISCVHFIEQQETCRLYNGRPPARVIAYGCESYNDVLEVPY